MAQLKKILSLAILLILLFPLTALATSGEEESLDAAGLAEEIDMDEFTAQLEKLDQLLAEEGADLSLGQLFREMLSGEREFSLADIWSTLGDMAFADLRHSGSLLGQLILLCLMAVLLTMLKNNFAGGEIAQISRWVVYLLLIGIAIAAFVPAMQKAAETVSTIRDFIYVLLPILVPLLASIGGITTVSLINPALLFALSILMSLMANLIFPLITFSAILRLCGGLTPQLSLAKMAALFKDIAMGVMGIVSTVFIAFLGFTGMSTASWDGLAVKAIKSASGAFIPIVGRSLADAFDSVIGTALILKNVLGVVGAIAILFICALPAIQILLQALVFRIAGALIQPLGEEKLADAVTGLGNSMIMLFAALAVSGLFAYFALALVVGLGNITMMMR